MQAGGEQPGPSHLQDTGADFFWRTKGRDALHLHGNESECVDDLTFLGVPVSRQLTWSSNTSQLVKRPNRDMICSCSTAEHKDQHRVVKLLSISYTGHCWCCHAEEKANSIRLYTQQTLPIPSAAFRLINPPTERKTACTSELRPP